MMHKLYGGRNKCRKLQPTLANVRFCDIPIEAPLPFEQIPRPTETDMLLEYPEEPAPSFLDPVVQVKVKKKRYENSVSNRTVLLEATLLMPCRTNHYGFGSPSVMNTAVSS
jgi:hypothetical protein